MQPAILYINPLSSITNITILAKENHTVLESITFDKKDLAASLPSILGELWRKYMIQKIWCITGPGPFTLTRVVCLAVNTLAFMSPSVELKGCHLFDLISQEKTALLELNKEEYLIRQNSTIHEIKKDMLPDGVYTGYAQTKDFTEGQTFIEYSEDISRIADVFESLPASTRLSPIYFKPPKITGSKKNI